MTIQPILVLGATGKTGSRIAQRLEDKGLPVRRGSRGAAIPFDWNTPDTWDVVLADVSSVYISYYPDIAVPGGVEAVSAFTEQAHAAGVGKIVLLTGRGEYHAQRAEEVVRNSGLPFTIVRAAWFAQNFSEGALHDPVMAGVLPMPGGDVQEPIVDVDDIADVAVAALADAGHDGETYEVTGPRLLTFAQMADVLSAATGRQITHVPISFEDFHAALLAGQGEMIADVLTAIARETLDGRNATLADGVQRALGRAPRDFATFADAGVRSGNWAEAA
ncbi:NmrA family NAD(P)-binding protein [Shimia thalassica]|uniref:NmrA family NAD(P)-binding protein n=1 Tax=Shimia thalassica TaxID=1715693 RepID=UPI001C098575|nr:NmrA family NAD(P)-binding protein [Shimia thalassica]MBU2941766.1 NAD(P)H-binding protein [Shimia thalassica]MDO6503853.1 NmrA family NAD(P)-binding protein [Shimia thalassica]